MKKVLVIVGPTASGKTDFSLEMAEALHGEIISGDSIQMFRGLDIGSGKIRPEEMRGIPHHLIDTLDPKDHYSVAQFQQDARREIDNCPSFPIIAGGTGLYLKACLYDYQFSTEEGESPADPEFEEMDTETLYDILLKQDPKQAEKIHANNRRRIIRTLTILKRTGTRQSDIVEAQEHRPIYDVWFAGCTMDRALLHERIARRTQQMIDEGLEEEVRGLLAQGVTFDDLCMRGIGYREWKPYFEGNASVEEVLEDIRKHSRQYARKQYTWLNHQMPVNWFEVLDPADRQRMKEEILAWAKNSNG
ncbi:MAG: tRNA (adenosine(37)-N6)-dimethylallyltransferase MiaA [Erysipelotrichaceae bacterium]|nr:tRNA (adenosine(37)-N6)-dimethylallyltransferase MiaA [Erysipelotrichaceae bacterium]